MPSADQVPTKSSHSTMLWHMWVVLIAGSTGSALRAVRSGALVGRAIPARAWRDDNARCPGNMDERQHRIERLDRLQEPDGRGGVDGQSLDHPGLAGLQIDRAVNCLLYTSDAADE